MIIQILTRFIQSEILVLINLRHTQSYQFFHKLEIRDVYDGCTDYCSEENCVRQHLI